MEEFWKLTFGNILTLVSIVVAFIELRRNQRNDQEESRRRTEERHEQNLQILNSLRIQIATMAHLDGCMDDVKEQVNALRNYIMDLIKQMRGRNDS